MRSLGYINQHSYYFKAFSVEAESRTIKMDIVVILLLSALTYSAANGLYIAEFVSLNPTVTCLSLASF